jgi:hypothetical protein
MPASPVHDFLEAVITPAPLSNRAVAPGLIGWSYVTEYSGCKLILIYSGLMELHPPTNMPLQLQIRRNIVLPQQHGHKLVHTADAAQPLPLGVKSQRGVLGARLLLQQQHQSLGQSIVHSSCVYGHF